MNFFKSIAVIFFAIMLEACGSGNGNQSSSSEMLPITGNWQTSDILPLSPEDEEIANTTVILVGFEFPAVEFVERLFVGDDGTFTLYRSGTSMTGRVNDCFVLWYTGDVQEADEGYIFSVAGEQIMSAEHDIVNSSISGAWSSINIPFDYQGVAATLNYPRVASYDLSSISEADILICSE